MSDLVSDVDAEGLFERAPCGYLTMLPNGTITRANRTFRELTGYSAADLKGRRFSELLSAGGRIYYETHLSPLLIMQGSVRELALELVRADGKRLPVLVNASLEVDSEHAPQLIRATLFDASHRREYERELLRVRDGERAARKRTEQLQDVSRALVATLDDAVLGAAVLDAISSLATSGQAVMLRVDEGSGVVEAIASIGSTPSTPSAGLACADMQSLRDLLLRGSESANTIPPPESLLGIPEQAWGQGMLIQPCAAGGRIVGALCLGRRLEAPVEETEAMLLAAVSEQSALALERQRLFHHEQDVARILQRDLLAGALPADPRLEIAAVYEPGVRDLSVGGDWHDAFANAPDQLMLVVGDIVGRGVRAASTMGRLRSAVRALAVAGLSPGEILRQLDSFVELDEPARMATLICAVIDLASGEVRLASAGHPPALLLAETTAPQLIWEGRSLPLGVIFEPRPRPETTCTLHAGSRLVLYTDGLVERRGHPIDRGLDALIEVAAEGTRLPLAQMLDDIKLRLCGDEPAEDDVCLMGAHRA